MMRIRRLTDAGLDAMTDAITELAATKELSGFLIRPDDAQLTEPHPIALTIDENVALATRYEAAEYLHTALGDGRIEDVEHDLRLWAWLSLVWFDQLCPADGNGKRKLGELARYIPSTEYTKRYRHLLAGPYRLFQAHVDAPERALVVLSGPLDKPGELAEQLGSRVEIAATPSIIAAATDLYIDSSTMRPKHGAAGNGRGSARRFGRIVRQYDLTWDLAAMSAAEIVERLPSEFDRFRR